MQNFLYCKLYPFKKSSKILPHAIYQGENYIKFKVVFVGHPKANITINFLNCLLSDLYRL